MPDPRVASYAQVLVDQCLDVQPGWEVLIQAQPAALPLVDEVARAVEFFAGPLGDFVSGEVLRIDGGAYS